jgi:hypothetical protein
MESVNNEEIVYGVWTRCQRNIGQAEKNGFVMMELVEASLKGRALQVGKQVSKTLKEEILENKEHGDRRNKAEATDPKKISKERRSPAEDQGLYDVVWGSPTAPHSLATPEQPPWPLTPCLNAPPLGRVGNR